MNVSAQAPGCPNINAGADQNLNCQTNCTNLTATVLQTGQTTSYTVSSIPYAPPAAFNTGTQLLIGTDDIFGPVINLGFNFCFYGNMYNQAVVGANGLITFDISQANQFCAWAFTASIPSTALYPNSIMGAYHDIDPGYGGEIRYALLGSAPCRTLVVNFNNIPHFDCNCQLPAPFGTCRRTTQQIVIYETTNVIEVYLQQKETCSSWNSGNAVIGIQDATATNGITPPGRNTGPWTANNEAWRFTPSGPPNWTVTWYDQSNNVVGNGLTVNVCPTGTTTYTGEAVYQHCDGTVVTVTDNVTVNIAGGFTTNQNVTPESCGGSCDGAVTVTANGGTPPYTFNLNGGANQNNGTFNNLCSGNYTVNISDAGGCTGTVNVVINAGGSITVNSAFTNETCAGANDGTITLTASGGTAPYGYDIGFGAPNTTGIFTNLPAGTYNYTVADASQCPTTGSVTIQPGPNCCAMTNTLASTDPTCTSNCDGTITLTETNGNAPVQFSINNGTTFQNNGNFTGLCAGTYDILIVDALNCQYTNTVTLTNDPGFSLNSSSSTNASCNGVCDGTASVTATPGYVGTLDYDWIDLATNSSIGQLTANASNLCAGNYQAIATDDDGCTATTNVTITEPVAVGVTLSAPTTICIGSSTQLNATPSGGTAPYTYQWAANPADPTLLNPTVANPTVSPVVTTTYTVNVSDNNNCAAPPQQVTVTLRPPLTLTMQPPGPIDICPGENASINMNATGGDGNYVFTWDGGNNPLNPPATVSPSQNTTYTFTVNDGCGTPPVSQTVDVNIYPLPVIDFSANITSGCQPLRVTFTDNTVPQPATLTWNFGDPASGTNNTSTATSPTHAYDNPGVYSVTLNVTTSNGCKDSLTIQDMITVFPLPHAEFIALPSATNILNPEIQFNNQSQGETIWFWDFGDNTNSTLENPLHVYSDTGTYNVWLIAGTPNGCFDSVSHPVEILPIFTFYVPSAFTPNSDGTNDAFFAKGENIDPNTYIMRVFNRWGQQVFTAYSMDEKWDGTAKGLPAQEDVYVWVAEMRDVIGEKHKFYGRVTLYR